VLAVLPRVGKKALTGVDLKNVMDLMFYKNIQYFFISNFCWGELNNIGNEIDLVF